MRGVWLAAAGHLDDFPATLTCGKAERREAGRQRRAEFRSGQRLTGSNAWSSYSAKGAALMIAWASGMLTPPQQC